VRRLCRVLTAPREMPKVRGEQGLLSGDFPLQPIQRWFFEQPFASPQHWNQGVILRLPPGIGWAQLMDHLRQLMRHHDALRLAVTVDGQTYREFLSIAEPARLDATALGPEGLQQALTDLQAHLQPECARTFAWALIEGLPNGERGLFMAFHHLVIDAVSWRILVEDLQRLGRGEALPAKTSSYRQWGEGLARYARQAQAQLPYWQSQTAGMDYRIASEWSAAQPGQGLLELDEALTRQLAQRATRYFEADMRELLLAALTRALVELGLGDRHWIMLEGHGREPIEPTLDASRTVGWFTSMFPVRVDNLRAWPDLVRHAAGQLRQVPDKGVGYLPLRCDPAHRDSLPLPPVALNYLGVYQSGAGDWQALPLAPGNPSAVDNGSAELISLHGGIFDGRLTLRQIGSLRADLGERLLASLRANLSALAALAGGEQ